MIIKLDVKATLIEIADEIEAGMDESGETSSAWTKKRFAETADGFHLDDTRSADAAKWCVFGHIKRRLPDRPGVRDSFAAALAQGMDADMRARLNETVDFGVWNNRQPYGSDFGPDLIEGFGRSVELALAGAGGDFWNADYVASIMENLNDAEGVNARDIVGWLRLSAERYGARMAQLDRAATAGA